MQKKRDQFLALIARRSAIMGILNVTPDSFSDGGRFQAHDCALAQAQSLPPKAPISSTSVPNSTRPGHMPFPLEEEWRGSSRCSAATSQATPRRSRSIPPRRRSRAARSRWRRVVNDVWGLQRDPDMADVVAESGAAAVVMHNRDTRRSRARYRRRHAPLFRPLARACGPRGNSARTHPPRSRASASARPVRQNCTALQATARLRRGFRPADPDRRVAQTPVRAICLAPGSTSRLIGTLAANFVAAARGASRFSRARRRRACRGASSFRRHRAHAGRIMTKIGLTEIGLGLGISRRSRQYPRRAGPAQSQRCRRDRQGLVDLQDGAR